MKKLKNLLLTSFSVGITRIVSLLIGVLCALMMDISTFGFFTLFFTVFVVVSEIPEASNITYVSFLEKKFSGQQAEIYLSINILWKLIYVIAIISLCLIAYYINSFYDYFSKAILETICFAAISGGLVSIYGGGQAYYLARSDYFKIAILKPLFLFIVFIFISLSYLTGIEFGIEFVYTYFIVSALIVVLLTFWLLRSKVNKHVLYNRRYINDYFINAYKLTVYSLITLISARVDVFIISSLLHIEDLGTYGVALRIAGVIGLLVTVIHIYMLPKAKAALLEKQQARLYVRESGMLTVTVILFTLFSLAIIKPVVLSTFGEVYSMAVAPASILVIAIGITALGIPKQILLQVAGDSSFLNQLAIIKLIAAIPLTYYLVSVYGVLGASISLMLMNLLTFILLSVASSRLLQSVVVSESGVTNE